MTTSTTNDLIFQTKHFTVERAPQPFISREEGGHIRIFAQNPEHTSTADLSPKEAIELMRLEMVVRDAMIAGMNRQGVTVIWVNIEELGNWPFKKNQLPQLHLHVFGRVADAAKQVWPEAPYLPARESGFYDDFVTLTDEDLRVIRSEIESRLALPKYTDAEWGLN